MYATYACVIYSPQNNFVLKVVLIIYLLLVSKYKMMWAFPQKNYMYTEYVHKLQYKTLYT